MIVFAGLELPETCPACGSAITDERRSHRLKMLTLQYECDAVLSARFVDGGPDHVTQASTGCRKAMERVLHPNRSDA